MLRYSNSTFICVKKFYVIDYGSTFWRLRLTGLHQVTEPTLMHTQTDTMHTQTDTMYTHTDTPCTAQTIFYECYMPIELMLCDYLTPKILFNGLGQSLINPVRYQWNSLSPPNFTF